MTRERGNILFLILLAVILYAALSFAVTQSLRGGGADATSEKNELLASEMVLYATSIQTAINRLELTQVDQVYFNDSAPNSAGTVYLGDGQTRTGKTVGLFNPAGGMPSIPKLSREAFTDYPNASIAYQIRIHRDMAGNHRGTALADKLITIPGVTENVCRAINKGILGSTDIPSIVAGATAGYTYWAVKADGTTTNEFNPNAVGSNSILIPHEIGCFEMPTPGIYRYHHMVKTQ